MATNVPRQSIPHAGLVALAACGLVFFACGLISRYECKRECRLIAAQPGMAMSYAEPVFQSEAAVPVSVDAVEFGTFTNAHEFAPTLNVPYKIKQEFGWRMKVEGNADQSVSWVEELVSPGVPQTWGGPSRHRRVSEDGLMCTTWFNEYPSNGYLENSWQVAEGDPKGTYTARIYVNNELVKTIDFEIK